MRTIVVGDIHGRLTLTNIFLGMASEDTRVIFVGDFLDSYRLSPDDQVDSLCAVMDAIAAGKNVLACKGNHEISYLDPREICSGWNSVTQSLIDSIGKYRIENTLLDCVWVEGEKPILISHAGVSAAHFDKEPEDITVRDVEEWLLESPNVGAVGYARGGYLPVGGIFWCDWWREFDPIPAIRQIVGHSNYRPRGEHGGVVTMGENYNIDCLGRANNEYVAIDENGRITVEFLGDRRTNYVNS